MDIHLLLERRESASFNSSQRDFIQTRRSQFSALRASFSLFYLIFYPSITFSREKLSYQSSSILLSWSFIILTSLSLSFTIYSHLIFKSKIQFDISSWDLIFISTFLNQSSVNSSTCNFSFSIKDSFCLMSVSKKYFVSPKAFISISFC